MHTLQFTYFNVWAQSSHRHVLSLAASMLLSAVGCRHTKKIGRERIPALCQHAELPLIKSTERDEQKHKKEDRTDSWCSPFTAIRLHHRPLVHLPTSDVFWIIVIGEDVDSDAACFYPCFDLRRYVNADKRPGQECLIGILQARFILKLVLLQCLSWTGIFMREDIILLFQIELRSRCQCLFVTCVFSIVHLVCTGRLLFFW